MIEVIFCSKEDIEDSLLEFAVIIAKYKDKFIFCRHKERTTWEVPGGHREAGETIEAAAVRELYEESRAAEFDIRPITVYGVKNDEKITYGMLFFADVKELSPVPAEYEIAEITLCDELPNNLTYPQIQPVLWDYVRKEMQID